MIGFQTIYLLNEQWYYNFSNYLDMSMAGKYRPVPNLLWQPMDWCTTASGGSPCLEKDVTS